MRSQFLAAVLSFVILIPGSFGGEKTKTANKPATAAPLTVLEKPAPETVEELRAIEKQVQAVVAKVQAATVGVFIGAGAGSGVIIKDGYVLTAGHVSGKPRQNVVLRLADGRKLKGKSLGNNGGIDSGLIKIEDKGTFPSVEMGKSADLKKGQWVVSIGHPGGYRPNRSPVVRLGRVQSVNANVIMTDCALVGGDSGGPLFDMNGKVIGIHSRIGPFMTQNFHVPVDTYVTTFDRLARGEAWGGQFGLGALVQSPGGAVVLEKKQRLTLKDARDKQQKSSYSKTYTFKMGPGSLFTIDLTSQQIDSFLRLEDSTGKELARDDDSAGNVDARILFRPSKEDNYRLVVTTFQPNQTGSFTLTVRRLDLKDLLVEGKVNVRAALKLPRFAMPLLLRQFGGWSGSGIYVHGTILDAQGKPAANKEIQFSWDKEKSALKTNAEGVVRLRLNRNHVNALMVDVPEKHRALLELRDGNGKIRFFNLAAGTGQQKAVTPSGTIVLDLKSEIGSSDPMDKVRKQCRHKVHPFKVNGGTKAAYTIDLESLDFDAYLRVEGSDGKQIAEDDDSAGEYNSRVTVHPAKDGNIRIIVTTCDPGQSGAYRLVVRQSDKK